MKPNITGWFPIVSIVLVLISTGGPTYIVAQALFATNLSPFLQARTRI
jgi:hypothetical protein